jgi:hypothetical protein
MFGQIKRKIVQPLYFVSLVVLLLAFAFHFGQVRGTVAFSSDVEKSEGNKFQAGTWGTAPATPSAILDHIVISEVFYDPVGNSDTGKEWVELYNGTSGDVDMSGKELNATSGDYFQFPGGFKLSQHSFVVVHWRADGTNTLTDLYTGTTGYGANMGDSTGWVALFKNNTQSKDTIIDYIEYGAGGQTAESKAVDAGIWTVGNFVPDASPGHSLERKDKNSDSNLVSDFKDQTIPTPGS